MGVPFLYRYLLRKYPQIKLSGLPSPVASLSIDGNGTLHRIAAEVYGYGDFADEKRVEELKEGGKKALKAAEQEYDRRLLEYLTDLLVTLAPTETFSLKFDGKAPLAKIQQQRWRRYRSAIRQQSPVFDSNAISPGTLFMRRVDRALRAWLTEHTPPFPPQILYSSHLGEGEGEHKIYEDFRSGAIWSRHVEVEAKEAKGEQKEKGIGAGEQKETKAGLKPSSIYREHAPTVPVTTDGYHIVYGLDADLLVLALLSPLPRILLVRENLEDIVDIDVLRQELHFDLSGGNPSSRPSAIRDLALMLELIGNDFVPAGPAMENMEHAIPALIETYDQVGVNLTTEAGIDWANFNFFLQLLAEREPTLLQGRHRAEQALAAHPDSEFQPLHAFGELKTGFDLTDFASRWYAQAFDPVSWGDHEQQLRALVPDFDAAPVEDDIIQLVTDYQDILEWNLRYYTRGYTAASTDKYYPFHYAPLLSDLAQFIPSSPATIRAEDTKIIYSVLHQLVAIIPPPSMNLLPTRVRALYRPGSLIEDQLPLTVVVDPAGKAADHLALVLMPFADVARIIDAVGRLELWERDRRMFLPAADLVQRLPPQAMEMYAFQAREYARTEQELKYRAQLRLAQSQRGRGRGRGRGGFRGRGGERGGFRGRGAPRGRGGDRGRGRGGFRGAPRGRGRGVGF